MANIAKRINALHAKALESAECAIDNARAAGALLLKAKSELEHGTWLQWQAANTADIGQRVAQKYMQISANWKEIEQKRQTGAYLGINGACRLIARPKPETRAPETPQTDCEPINVDAESVEDDEDDLPDYGQCPNCGGTKWDDGHLGIACDNCRHPFGEPAGDAPVVTPDNTCRACIPADDKNHRLESLPGDERSTAGYMRDHHTTVSEGVGASLQAACDAFPDDTTEATPKEPEAAESAGTWLREALLEAIEDWLERDFDAPKCLVGGILESLAVNWESELED